MAAATTLAALVKRDEAAANRADRWSLVLLISLDLQLMLGLLLYFVLSPFTTQALKHLSGAMQNPPERFFVVDHIAMMFGAVILVHVARILGRKATTPEGKRTRMLFCIGLAMFAMLGGIPWPGLPGGRPLFRI